MFMEERHRKIAETIQEKEPSPSGNFQKIRYLSGVSPQGPAPAGKKRVVQKNPWRRYFPLSGKPEASRQTGF